MRNFILLAVICLLSLSLQAQQPATFVKVKAPQPFTIVIDPGHGGRDPGKPRADNVMHEKNINLAIAKLLGSYISERIEGATVIYTRTDDSFVSLDDRVNIANFNQADFFVSIHCNSLANSHYHGTQSHIQSHSFATSKGLANEIEKQFSQRAGRRSRGVYAHSDRGFNYQVLQYTNMPGALIECGFLSNAAEGAYLSTASGQDVIASAIFRGFRDFIMLPTPPPADDRSKFYKVQVVASRAKEAQSRFRHLGMRVDEFTDPEAGAYKYLYMIGREYDVKAAHQLMRKVRQQGFKDAFVVEFTPELADRLVLTRLQNAMTQLRNGSSE